MDGVAAFSLWCCYLSPAPPQCSQSAAVTAQLHSRAVSHRAPPCHPARPFSMCAPCSRSETSAALTLLRPLSGVLNFMIALGATAAAFGAYGAGARVDGLV